MTKGYIGIAEVYDHEGWEIFSEHSFDENRQNALDKVHKKVETLYEKDEEWNEEGAPDIASWKIYTKKISDLD